MLADEQKPHVKLETNDGGQAVATSTPAITTATTSPPSKQKRKKTSRACNHCHKAHMTCDSGRPCKRCIQRGFESTCQDAPRKRKKYLDDIPNSSLNSSGHAVDGKNIQSLHTPSSTFEPARTESPQVQPQQREMRERIPEVGAQPQVDQSQSVPPAHLPSQNPQLHAQDHIQPQCEPQSQQSPFPAQPRRLPQPHELEVSNHRTHEATMFQHSSTAPELTHPFLPDTENHHHHQNHQNQQQQQRVYGETNSHTHHPYQLSQHSISLNSQSNHINPQSRTKFMSSAADLEYATLSNILQDTFGHQTTSNEGTPNSHGFSPTHSPHNLPNNAPIRPHLPSSEALKIRNESFDHNATTTPSPLNHTRASIYEDSSNPKCDDSINQYFVGKTDSDNTVFFPDVITAIDQMKNDDYVVYRERNSKSKLSFSVGILPEDSTSQINSTEDTLYKEPEEIYAKVRKPFSYTPGYHSLIAYLRKRFSKPMLVKMAESMAAYRPSFIACTNSLKEHDLIFMEQCFQRTLLTYDNFVKISGTPTIVWRRTGEIAYVGDEFCILTGWSKEELLGGKTTKKKFIVELLDDKSVLEYFQVFSRIAFGDFLGATMTECTLLTPKGDVKIRTGCMWTLKRDVFGIPMMIVGNFLPIL